MELRYRQYFIASCIDRAGPILRFVWFPILAILRLFWIAYWLIYPFQVSTVEIIIVTFRVAILAFGVFVVSNKWDDATKPKFGVGLHWAARAIALLVGMQQVVAKHNDPQVMAGIVSFLCFCGLVIPRFTEYLVAAVPLPLIRPLLLHLAGHPADHVQQLLFQNLLILALGLSITWTVHSDYRRDWLRLPAASAGAAARGRMHRRRKSTSQLRPTSGCDEAAAVEASWDTLEDGYFTDAERAELREQAVQARRPPPRALHDSSRRGCACSAQLAPTAESNKSH